MKPSWRYAKAAVSGTRYAVEGRICQDYAAARLIGTVRGNVFGACICDGAGSSPESATGARVAAEAFLDAVGNHLRESAGPITESDMRQFLSYASLALTLRAYSDDRPVRDYATTLIGVVVGDAWTGFVQVGDGAIVVPSSAGRWELVFEPQRGVYANETFFITDEAARLGAHVSVRGYTVSELSLFSDGLERLLIREAAGSPVAEDFFKEMMCPVRSSQGIGNDPDLARALSAYLSSEAINARTDDDKSLILASRLAPVSTYSVDGSGACDSSHAPPG